jgi:hypothetical protein
MPALDLALDAIDRLTTWLGLVRTSRIQRTQTLEDALEAIHRAANKTRAYIADTRAARRRDGRRADRAAEMELSNLWLQVGMALQRVHDDDTALLSRKCFEKAQYWADPELWTDANIRDAGIGLDRVTNDVVDLLEERL